MKRLKSSAVLAGAVAAVMAMMPASAAAAPLLLNGSFESGFAGWTRANQLGSEGTFLLQSGSVSPVNGVPAPPPPDGATAAMTDAEGPGSHVLYQDFLVPIGTVNGTLTFDLFVRNVANMFFTPSTLDFGTPTLNQQARVDILRTAADPFSVAPADVLLTLFQTTPGSPLVSGYSTVTANLSALLAANAGSMLRLRFAEVDNVAIFNLGVDRVSLEAAPIPEPASLALLATGLTGMVVRRRRLLRHRA